MIGKVSRYEPETDRIPTREFIAGILRLGAFSPVGINQLEFLIYRIEYLMEDALIRAALFSKIYTNGSMPLPPPLPALHFDRSRWLFEYRREVGGGDENAAGRGEEMGPLTDRTYKQKIRLVR
jgi:hypothetical protein